MPTDQQRLASVIKSARDIMRVDEGMNGDLDRIPQLAWLLFLKAFDELEDRTLVTDSNYRPVIPDRLRWHSWARNTKLTGAELLDFVNGELLPGLRRLGGKGSSQTRGDTLRAIFSGMDNRMRSGAQLRLLINKLDEINFASSNDVNTLAFLYESMLREMRDAAGDSGEFYTPRPVVSFMVRRLAPRLGESVLDPAAGTCGFLVEVLKLLDPVATSVDTRERLHKDVRGIEKKSLPYLLGTMNLLLHRVDSPVLALGNALTMLRGGSKRSQVDVIVTNPPFGGAETREVLNSFPKGEQTSETTWLFLIRILDRLKATGRCALVVPNSVLFDTGVAPTAIKKRLLSTCNLHTIIRLPEGVFSPYTPIATNLLFFEKGAATEEVWYYQMAPSGSQKRYSKTRPLRDEEFHDVEEWWGGEGRSTRQASPNAWVVPVEALVEADYNLDMRNPNSEEGLEHKPVAELVRDMIDVESGVMDGLRELERWLSEQA